MESFHWGEPGNEGPGLGGSNHGYDSCMLVLRVYHIYIYICMDLKC